MTVRLILVELKVKNRGVIMNKDIYIREAVWADLRRILLIYNQGIEDRIATLELESKDMPYMEQWFKDHGGRYAVLAAEMNGDVVGWASLNRYSPRRAYDGVADLSVYIDRAARGNGIGTLLLQRLEEAARKNDFHKIVLFTFTFNRLGQGLYRKQGYREVGVFRNQGKLDERFVDVMAMEKLLVE
jgi:L-amino acid N-acyltransferase YncA